MGALRAGIQRVNITPPIGTPLGGYIARRGPSEGVHDELFATALVLSDGKETLILVGVDVIAIPTQMDRRIRREARRLTGAPKENILIAATHTHSGPALLFGYQGRVDAAYRSFLTEAIVGCIVAAWRKMRPAAFGVGEGRVQGLGVNRRSPEQGPYDPRVGVLRVDAEGEVLGLVLNATCHPTVLGPDNLLISRDYPGYVVEALEGTIGGKVIFTNGAAGDVNPGHSADLCALGLYTPGRTFAQAKRKGFMLAGEVMKVAMSIEPSSSVPLGVRAKRIDLPLRPLPTLREAETRLKEKTAHLKELRQKEASPDRITAAEIEKLYAELLLHQVREAGQGVGCRGVWLQAMRIGNCALLVFPGELFVEIGLHIKTHSPFAYTYIVGYGNGYCGYLPTTDALEQGGYEVVMSRFAPGTDELVEEAAGELLSSLS